MTDTPAPTPAAPSSPTANRPDYRVYVVTAGVGPEVAATAAAAAAAGAGVVQVRAKLPDREVPAREALALLRACSLAVAAANPSTRILIDDRADVAYAARREGLPVHGVHLGQTDLPPEVARQMLGADALIGLTTGTLELVDAAERFHQSHPGVLDYLGAGPFRPTPTKDSGREPLGLAGYPPLVAATRLPIIAIGDVTPADTADLAATGVAGCAMVRSIMGAADPAAAVSDALRGWDRGVARR